MTTRNAADAGLIGPDRTGVRRFSVLFARWPMLPAQTIEESPFASTLAKANEIETAQKRLRCVIADADSLLGSLRCVGDRQYQNAVRDVRRRLAANRMPSPALRSRLAAGVIPGLDQALDEIRLASRALDTAETEYRNAMTEAIEVDRREMMSLISSPLCDRALGISNPELLDLAERYLTAGVVGDGRPARRVARTLRRVIWRAAARPTPFGLLASTSVAIADAAPRSSCDPPKTRVLCAVRPAAAASLMRSASMVDMPGLPPSPASLEEALWRQAFDHPSALSAAFVASELRTSAEAIESGHERLRLSRRAARSVVVEAISVEEEPVNGDDAGESLAALALLGSALIDGRGAGSLRLLRAWFDAEFPTRDCIPLAAFSAHVEARLTEAMGGPVVQIAPLAALLLRLDGLDASSDSYRTLVQAAIDSGTGQIALTDVAALSDAASNPRRIAAKLRPTAIRDDGWVMALRHFGGTSMSYALRYAHLAAAVVPDFVDRMKTWFSQWPDTVQLLVHPERRMARFTVLPCYSPEACDPGAAAADQAPETLYVRREADTLAICRGQGGHPLSLVTGELYAETALPFIHRLALLLGRGRPSALEGLLASIGMIIAERLGAAERETIVMPRVCAGNHLELASTGLIIPGRALAEAARDPRTVWRLLEENGFPPGPVEARPLNRALEPAVLDTRHPDGAAWLGRMAARDGSLIVVPLPNAYVRRNGIPTHVDLCVELTHTRSGS